MADNCECCSRIQNNTYRPPHVPGKKEFKCHQCNLVICSWCIEKAYLGPTLRCRTCNIIWNIPFNSDEWDTRKYSPCCTTRAIKKLKGALQEANKELNIVGAERNRLLDHYNICETCQELDAQTYQKLKE